MCASAIKSIERAIYLCPLNIQLVRAMPSNSVGHFNTYSPTGKQLSRSLRFQMPTFISDYYLARGGSLYFFANERELTWNETQIHDGVRFFGHLSRVHDAVARELCRPNTAKSLMLERESSRLVANALVDELFLRIHHTKRDPMAQLGNPNMLHLDTVGFAQCI